MNNFMGIQTAIFRRVIRTGDSHDIHNVSCILAQMQTMCNHTERCCISNYHGTSLMHNKAKKPIGKEINYLPLIYSGTGGNKFT